MALRRSLLFVPGAEPRKLERARQAAADLLILDLEDAVALEQKAEARVLVADALRAGLGGKDAAVRINAAGTPHHDADVEAMVEAGARAILLPKAETAEEVASVANRLQKLEAPSGREDLRLLLLVESPLGIMRALALGGASARVDALCFGHADFSLSMGLTDADASRGVVRHARCSLVIAAKACGVAPIDTVYLDVKNEAAFREDAALGLRLGFEGKLCIHPRQAEIANEVYTPARAEIDHALRVVEAAERAEAEGRGVFSLDGRMIDAPLVTVQRRVLERARLAGVLAARA